MKLSITFKHLDHTPALDQRIREKSEHFEKYFQGKITLSWVCWVKDEQHWAELKLHGPKFDFFAKGCEDNMYKTLDTVVEKMERQLEKQKDIMRNKMHKSYANAPKYAEQKRMIRDENEAHEEWEDTKTA